MNSAERELRDRFAMAALAAMTQLCEQDEEVAGWSFRERAAYIARATYMIADAMIRERAKEDYKK